MIAPLGAAPCPFSPPSSFLAAATPLIHYFKHTTLWAWSFLTLYNVGILCVICALLLLASTYFVFTPPTLPTLPQVAPTPATLQGPITLLPPELLVEVFVDLNPGRPYFDDLHTAMRVCRTWRRTALGAPRLWCAIECGHKMPLARFNTYLWRSKTVPLSVTVSSYASELHVALLFAHMHRLRALHLGPLLSSEALVQLLSRPAPALQQLYIAVDGCHANEWRIPRDLFAGQAPQLKKLIAVPHQLPDVGTCPALAQVDEFETASTRDTTLPDIAKVFRFCPALRSIVVEELSAESTNAPLPDVWIPTGLDVLQIVGTNWTDSRRAGTVRTLDMLPVPTALLWRADAETIHDIVASTIDGASMTTMSYRRTSRGGRFLLTSEERSRQRAFVNVSFVEFRKTSTLLDALLFERLTQLNMPGKLPASDLPLPTMPQLLRLSIVFTPEECDLEGDKCIFKLVHSLASLWPLPALQELAVLYRAAFGAVLAADPVPSSTAPAPFISAGELAYFVTHVLVFGNGQERLDRLTVSPRLQIEEDGGFASAEYNELRGLAMEFCCDEV